MKRIGLIGVVFFFSCININVPNQITFLGNGSIVLQGTMSATADGTCPLWVGDNGMMFVLFQSSRIPNADFDAITTPGTSSRLELRGRPDLGLLCEPGAENAEVVRILAIEGEDLDGSSGRALRAIVDGLINETRTGLTERRDEITQNLRDLIDEADGALAAKRIELQEAVNEIFESLRDQLQDGDTVKDQLDEFVAQLQSRIDELANELELIKEEVGDNIRDRIDEFVENLRTALDNPLAELLARFSGIDVDKPDFEDRLREAGDAIRQALEDRLEERRQQTIERIEELRAQIEEELQALIDELRGRLTPDLPDPKRDIPPVLDDLLPRGSLLVLDIRGQVDEFLAEIIEELQALIDELGIDSAITLADLIEAIIEELEAAEAEDAGQTAEE